MSQHAARMALPPVELPEKLMPIFGPQRYTVIHGGRGGAKSWSVARALLVMGRSRPLRILCCREIMKSMAESVHQLLKDQIVELGLQDFYVVLDKEIRGRNGTLFIFAGLRFNILNIRSKEGIDVVWIEEAADTSKMSWDTLIPTIRKPHSRIIISFNPELDDDETYKRFVLKPPPDAVVIEQNWRDNPWFLPGSVLDIERRTMKERDPVGYLTTWEGKCRQSLEGSIFANELMTATEEKRIGKVPWQRGVPVHTFWDLGYADMTAIWFLQSVGFEYRLIDFLQDRKRDIPYFMKALQAKPYAYGTHYLPHDGEHQLLAAGGRSIQDQVEAFHKNVEIVPRVPAIAQSINAARAIFGNCWFDAEACADGVAALRRYAYKIDASTGRWSRYPDHGDNFGASHAASAFMGIGLTMEPPQVSTAERRYGSKKERVQSWITQ